MWFTALLGLGYAGARLPGPFALFDNLSNFPAHFAVAFLACAAALAACRRRLPAMAAVLAALLPIAQVAPWYFGPDEAGAGGTGPSVKLLVSNVYYGNRQHDRLLRLVEREDPDVVGLLEIDKHWRRKLASLRQRYPHHYEVPAEMYVGLGLYSKLPIENARTLYLPHYDLPIIEATLATPEAEVRIILVHLPSPIDAALIRRRNLQSAELARYVRALDKPTLLAGDLNMTMWNRAYRPLEDTGGLANARAGYGAGPTWPAPWPIGVPIDHILATDGIRLADFRVLPAIGSDHLPIAARFSLRR